MAESAAGSASEPASEAPPSEAGPDSGSSTGSSSSGSSSSGRQTIIAIAGLALVWVVYYTTWQRKAIGGVLFQGPVNYKVPDKNQVPGPAEPGGSGGTSGGDLNPFLPQPKGPTLFPASSSGGTMGAGSIYT